MIIREMERVKKIRYEQLCDEFSKLEDDYIDLKDENFMLLNECAKLNAKLYRIESLYKSLIGEIRR
jgi:hypothetical protein